MGVQKREVSRYLIRSFMNETFKLKLISLICKITHRAHIAYKNKHVQASENKQTNL